MSVGILTWPNESGLDNYPLVEGIGTLDFILDASFLQFDAFIPTLKKVVVTQEDIVVTIEFDEGEVSTTILRSGFEAGTAYHFSGVGSRNLGKIVVGDGATWLWSNLLNQTVVLSVPFIPSVVISVPAEAGLYSLGIPSEEKFTGALIFKLLDSTMRATDSGNGAFIDAVALPTDGGYKVLKKLNGVSPASNNVSFDSSQTIKIAPAGVATLNLRLVTDDIYRDASLMPTLNAPQA